MTDSTWDQFVMDGDILYDYLTTHFEDMFEPSGEIKKFDMRYMSYLSSGYYEGVMEECGEQVHQEIIPWIREEHQSGRLFTKENWKPFRDQLRFTTMYYGYRTLFCFHDFFYFQLAVAKIVHDKLEGGVETSIDFNVALYGWKDKDSDMIQPDDQVILQQDMAMPERHWTWK